MKAILWPERVAYLAARSALVLALLLVAWFGRHATSDGVDHSSALPWLRPSGTFAPPLEEASVKLASPPREHVLGSQFPCPGCAAPPKPAPRFPLSRVLDGKDCSCGRDLEVRLVVRDAEIWRGCSLCLRDAVASTSTRGR